jgi:hypothetical protein
MGKNLFVQNGRLDVSGDLKKMFGKVAEKIKPSNKDQ